MSPADLLMNFAEAMRAVTDGLSVRRAAWDDPDAIVKLETDTLSIRIAGTWRPWIVSREDVLARDWMV